MGFSYFLYQFIQKLPAKRGKIVEKMHGKGVSSTHLIYDDLD